MSKNTEIIHVTLSVPSYLLPTGTKDPAGTLQVLLAGFLVEFGIRVVKVRKWDARKLVREAKDGN